MSSYQDGIEYWHEPEKEPDKTKKPYERHDEEAEWNRKEMPLDYSHRGRHRKHAHTPPRERPDLEYEGS